jgi:hypothetical protein
MANLTSIFLGISSFIAGAKALKEGLDIKPRKRRQLAEIQSPMKVVTYEVKSIEDRAKHIVGMIQKYRDNAQVRAITCKVLSQKCGKDWCVPEKNWLAECQSIYASFRKNVRYARDTYGKDLFQSPLRTLEFKSGDCDCGCICLGSMYQSVGYPVACRIIQTVQSKKEGGDWDHIYLIVGLPPRKPTKWLAADGSLDAAFGWEAPADMIARHKDFIVE